jgi:hypothetical protein
MKLAELLSTGASGALFDLHHLHDLLCKDRVDEAIQYLQTHRGSFLQEIVAIRSAIAMTGMSVVDLAKQNKLLSAQIDALNKRNSVLQLEADGTQRRMRKERAPAEKLSNDERLRAAWRSR